MKTSVNQAYEIRVGQRVRFHDGFFHVVRNKYEYSGKVCMIAGRDGKLIIAPFGHSSNVERIRNK